MVPALQPEMRSGEITGNKKNGDIPDRTECILGLD